MDISKWAESIKKEEFAILIVQHGNNLPTKDEMQNLASFSVQELADRDDDVRDVFGKISQINFPLGGGTYIGDYRDPNDIFGYEVKELFPKAKVINVAIEHIGKPYHCFLIWPTSQTDEYWRTDIVNLPIAIRSEETSFCTVPAINEFSDIRELLGGFGYKRQFTIAAGSPGWGTENLQNRTVSNRNEGRLDAAQNDFNSLFDILQGLTLDDVLPGMTCAGLVQTKHAFFSLFEYAMSPVDDFSLMKKIADDPGFIGTVLNNCKLTNIVLDRTAFVSGGSVDVSKDGSLSVKGGVIYNAQYAPIRRRHTERLIAPDFGEIRQYSSSTPYALIYYAGHGTKNGELMIERNQSISPYELFSLSMQMRLPFVIILDMCYSYRFGQQYETLMQEHDWPGIVIASCNGLIGQELSYESEKIQVPSNFVVTYAKPPDVAILRFKNQSCVGIFPPSTSMPHCPCERARR